MPKRKKNKTPILYFAFANGDDDQILSELKPEKDGIENELLSLDANDKIKLKIHSDADFSKIHRTIGSYDDQIVLFHYGGHADGDQLKLIDGIFNKKGIISTIKEAPNLKVVFLNGCSTEGLVNDLLKKTNVEAVIATTRSIEDTIARNFSIEFYKWLAAGNDIKRSFQLAHNLVKHEYTNREHLLPLIKIRNAVEKPTDTDVRGLRLRREVTPIVPWGLYVDKDKEETALAWKIAPIPEIDYEKIKVKEKELADTLERIKQFKTLGDLFKSHLETEEQKKEKILKELEQLRGVGTKIEIQGDLIDKFKRLNFNHQKEAIRKKIGLNRQYGAFIVKGSKRCGHRLITHGFKKRYVRNIGRTIRYIELNFSTKGSNKPSPDNIWEKIKEKLRKVPATLSDKKAILKTFYDEYLAKDMPQDFIFVFKNIEPTTDSYLPNIIKQFWEELFKYIKTQNKTISHRIFLFLMDHSLRFDKEHRQLTSNFDDTALLTGLKIPDVHVLPPIEPLKSDYLDKWWFNEELPAEIGNKQFNQIYFDAITKQENRVMPTIKNICEDLGMLAVYEKNFKPYDV